MATKAAEAERKRVESAVRGAVREEGFLCPECRKRSNDVVLNPTYGYVCAGCDWVIRLVD